MLGRYIIERRVGAGAMGMVFEGFDTDLRRRVAIKVCTTDSADTGQLIEHEARSLAKVQHSNVVVPFEIIRVGHDVALVMEFIEGQTLRDWLRDAKPTWREVLGCYVEAGQALAAVHAAGLEHADFKPDNVLIDAQGSAHVLDFGVAMHSTPPRDSGFMDVGTSGYMAPERLRLLRSAKGPSCDVFSFCVSVWESLYGVRPFLARTRVGLIEAIEQGRVQGGTPMDGLPKRMRAVLLEGLAADPAERYASMAEVLEGFASVMRDEQRREEERRVKMARETWAFEHRADRAAVRRWGAAVIVGALVVIGCGAYLVLDEPSPVEQRLALARVEAEQGNTTAAVQDLELARQRARRDGDTEALREVATVAEEIGDLMAARGQDPEAFEDSWSVAYDILIDMHDEEAGQARARLRRKFAEAKR
jgi:predicted Ser/Thr protein kinase